MEMQEDELSLTARQNRVLERVRSHSPPNMLESEHWAHHGLGYQMARDRNFEEYQNHIAAWQRFGWTRHHPAVPEIIRPDLPEGEDITQVPRDEILRRIGWLCDERLRAHAIDRRVSQQ